MFNRIPFVLVIRCPRHCLAAFGDRVYTSPEWCALEQCGDWWPWVSGPEDPGWVQRPAQACTEVLGSPWGLQPFLHQLGAT